MSPAPFAESTARRWTQRWMSLVVPNGPTRWRPGPDPVTRTFKHRRPESTSPCGRTGTQSRAASGGP
eukprot:13521659-Alexandrium_andersonii.AAC.1